VSSIEGLDCQILPRPQICDFSKGVIRMQSAGCQIIILKNILINSLKFKNVGADSISARNIHIYVAPALSSRP